VWGEDAHAILIVFIIPKQYRIPLFC